MRPHAPRILGLLAGALVLGVIISLGRGAVALSPLDVLRSLGAKLGLADASPQDVAIIWSVRMPRVVLALLVGSALGASGAALQGVVRNSLADPSLLGVSGGAALGAVAAIVLGAPALAHPTAGIWIVPAAAFAGALATTRLALSLARVEGATSGVTMLLAGIGIAALSSAGIGVLLYLADDAAIRSVTFWSLGSLGGATWAIVGVAAMPILLGLGALPRYARSLDQLALGETEARHVGVDVERVISRVVLVSALAVGAAVATCGVIGFVGLVVPYLGRTLLGPSHRALLPACALGGALLLLLADVLARTVVAPTELPIGVLTALAGAPILLAMVRKGRAQAVLA